MTLLALALVLAAGSLHATWNPLAKRASSGVSGPAFVWLCTVLSMLIFAPVAAIVLSENPHVGTLGLLFMLGTGILHTGYFLSLQEGYRVGDLSMIYPMAREQARCLRVRQLSRSLTNALVPSEQRAYS